MAQEIWFRSDLKNIIEGLALALLQSQTLSGAPQAVCYQHGFLSALVSMGSCLGIANLDLSIVDPTLAAPDPGTRVTVSGPPRLVASNAPPLAGPD